MAASALFLNWCPGWGGWSAVPTLRSCWMLCLQVSVRGSPGLPSIAPHLGMLRLGSDSGSARLGSHTGCAHAEARRPFHTHVPTPQVFAPTWTLLPHFGAEWWPDLCFSVMAFGAGAAWLLLTPPQCPPPEGMQPRVRMEPSHGCSWWDRTPMGGTALAGAAPGVLPRAQQTHRLLLHCCP